VSSRRTKPEEAVYRFHAATEIDERRVAEWRSFALTTPAPHYRQDPAWAAVETDGTSTRRPIYLWGELDGELCLTALGLLRRLPVHRRAFLEIVKGPLVRDAGVLEAWLDWLTVSARPRVARIHVQPALPVDAEGDAAETTLERAGYVRQRRLGDWATLRVSLDRTEDALFGSFRPNTRNLVRKSQKLGVTVTVEDDSAGQAVLADLQRELASRTPVHSVEESTLAALSRYWLRGGDGGTILVARHEGEPVAAALVIAHAGVAYLDSMPSSERHRTLPATYLLLWEAMRWAQGRGLRTFDLGGYSLMARPGDPLWGINQFKHRFAPSEDPVKYVAIHELVLSRAIVLAAAQARRIEAWASDLRRTDRE